MSNLVFTQAEFEELERNLLNFHVFGRTVDGKIAIRVLAPAQPGATHNFFTEAGAPGAGLGNVGDMYLDENTLRLYGPKTGTGWGVPVSLNEGKQLIETSAEGDDGYSIDGVPDLEDKMLVPFMSDIQNEGPATLDYKGLGPKAIVDTQGNPLCTKDIKTDRLVFTKYDAANDRFILLDPSIETYKTLDSVVRGYLITNAQVDRDYDINSTSADELMDVLKTFIDDLYESAIFKDTASACHATSIVRTWITNNVTGTRGYDANSTSLTELADVIGTLITDLKTANVFNGSTLQKTTEVYTVVNGTVDRAGDANSTTVNEMADILNTVIADLKVVGIIT